MSSGVDAASFNQWHDLWVKRSIVCASAFDCEYNYDPALPDRVALRDNLRSNESDSAAQAYEELTTYFKYDHSHDPELRPTLGPLALCAPDKISWDSLYAKAIRDFKGRGLEERRPEQG